MARLPSVTGKEAIKAFESFGFQLDRIAGSHHILKRSGHPYVLSVPVHGGKSLGAGLLASLIRDAGLTTEQFVEALG